MTDLETRLESIRPLLIKITHERVGAQTWLFDDALQEAMIAAWTRLADGHGLGIAVHAAKQAVLDVCRGRRMTGSKHAHGGQTDSHTRSTSIFRTSADGEEEYVFEPADHSSAVEQERFDARDALREAVSALSAREREIVHATYYGGLSRAEVAAQQGITHQGVSIGLKRAHEKMRKVIAA